MLVVTRRKGQRIVIGNDIEIVVSGISGSTVRLAVVAPRSVPVLRGEVFDNVREQNLVAAETHMDQEELLALLTGQPILSVNAPSPEDVKGSTGETDE